MKFILRSIPFVFSLSVWIYIGFFSGRSSEAEWSRHVLSQNINDPMAMLRLGSTDQSKWQNHRTEDQLMDTIWLPVIGLILSGMMVAYDKGKKNKLGPNASAKTSDKIVELGKLHQQGHLSDEEFSRLKSETLKAG